MQANIKILFKQKIFKKVSSKDKKENSGIFI